MNKFKVPIKNALFMYSYIWDKVDNNDYINLSSSDDFTSANIYAELFMINIKKIINRGLYKEYIDINDSVNIIKGKINFNLTFNNQLLKKGKVFCEYDELVENNIYNQIIKNIAIRLYKSSGISVLNKKKLNKIILYFSQVDYIELKKDNFKYLNFNKSNKYYYWMIKICELIYDAQMLSEINGKYNFYDLFNSDDNMNNVFELFIYKFYYHELSKDFKVKYQSILNWNISGGNVSLLPIMKLDTLITNDNETIIIDTKYYKNYFIENAYDKKELRSSHLYQMISYMNNIKCDNKLRGILLYPRPFNELNIDETYDVKVVSSNNKITDAKINIMTIDLSKDWKDITINLLKIIDPNLANKKKKELSSF